jgi:pyruvate-formate lyase
MEQALASPRQITDTRVGRLRDRIINAPQEVCVERARHLTQAMKLHWDKDPLTRMSLAFSHILDNISVIIRDDELIVERLFFLKTRFGGSPETRKTSTSGRCSGR